MSDLPFALEGDLASRLSAALDVEGKIVRALQALGPVADRDVILLGNADGAHALALAAAGGRVAAVPDLAAASALGKERCDTLVAWWSGFRGVSPVELRQADAVLRRGGRLLVVHDYGRDDVSRLRGELPEYGAWSRRNGPFLANGFRIRVLHCWWTFGSIEEAGAFLDEAFGEAGRTLAAELRRPRLSYNVAVYHRTRGGDDAAAAAGAAG